MAKYGTNSPYFNTETVNGQYLGFLKIRPVPAESDDFLYTIESQYTYRPDLLAYDLYDTTELWWVFAQRNMDVIKDPVYDIVPGTQIFIPKQETLLSLLGS